MRHQLILLALLLLVLAASCGGGEDSQTALSLASTASPAPAFEAELVSGAAEFPAALPDTGRFNPARVTALANLSQPGSAFDSSSANVAADSGLAEFAGSGDLEWAIWRFAGAPEDSIGAVRAGLASADGSADVWYAIADYSAEQWVWLGNGAELAVDFALGGAAGQHSSPAGYVYLAVVSNAPAPFSVESVEIDYSSRYSVSGTVLDEDGLPVVGALVTTNLDDPQQTLTDAAGSYTLTNIPEGDWAVMVSAYGYRFHGAMEVASISGADVTGLDFWGIRDFTPLRAADPYEPNDYDYIPAAIAGGSLEDATLSVFNDPADYYSFSVAGAGWYHLRFDGEHSILFPELRIMAGSNAVLKFSDQVIYGVNYVSCFLPAAGEYMAHVSCHGGGGTYSLSVDEGELSSISGTVYDESDENFAGEQYEEPYCAIIELNFTDFSMFLFNHNSGYFDHGFIPPLPAEISVSKALHIYSPASYFHDFAGGPLVDVDFDVQGETLTDPDEPNNDFASATPLTLPMDGYRTARQSDPDTDTEDNYVFTVTEGMHLMVRLRNSSGLSGVGSSLFTLLLYDSAEQIVSCQNYNSVNGHEIRSTDPLPAGTYYLKLYFSDDGRNDYALLIEEFEGREATFRMFIDGEPLDDVHAVWYLEDIGYFDEVEITSTGIRAIDCPFREGERVFYTLRRHGLSIDDFSSYITIGAEDIVIEPLISMTTDSFEPNDQSLTTKQVDYPINLSATISYETDSDDQYRFQTDSRDIRVSITAEDPDAVYDVTVYDFGGFSSSSTDSIIGSGECYLRTSENGDYYLRVSSYQAQGAYTLAVEDAEAFEIRGTIDHGKPGESYYAAPVTMLLPLNIASGNASGDYSLGFYPPGEYQIFARMANHNMNPAGLVSVEIVDADVEVDFTATYNYQDNLEPNDSNSTAAAIALPADFNATTDYANINVSEEEDRRDWYTFTAASDGFLEVLVDRNWAFPDANFYFNLREGQNSNIVADSIPVGDNMIDEYISYPVIAGETYWIQLYGGGDNRYHFAARIIEN